MKDLIVVDKEEDGICKGLRYYGDKENHTKTTNAGVPLQKNPKTVVK